MTQPNLVFVFADQLRYQTTGFGGDPNIHTPNLDQMAARGLNFRNAISGCPVCCPARASLLTGQYPHQHGVFVNDVCLSSRAVSLAQAYQAAGYDTAYIGKWHVDGHGRSNYIPPQRRQGFDTWQVLECTHDYNHSRYYADDDPTPREWPGYDAEAQTRQAQAYLREHDTHKPFCLLLSWGPPHNPYDSAPIQFQRMIDPARLSLRPNVPPVQEAQARQDLAGYYAHVLALDQLMGDLLRTLEEQALTDNTMLVFWSDHGDMLGSQGQWRKQRPWEESIHVPLLIQYPALFGNQGRMVEAPINTPDLMPTLLGLSGVQIPATVTGNDYSPYLRGEQAAPADAVLLACYQPFGEFTRLQHEGREYRGVRTARYTYVRDLHGAWLLYDNLRDRYQQRNLVGSAEYATVKDDLDRQLNALLAQYGDGFLPGERLIEQWGYSVDETGTVPYTN
ncbi:MAG TPA: sulfatase [Anaerolineae bacterium]